MTPPDQRPFSAASSFGETADAYLRHRPGYPETVFDTLTSALQGPTQTCIDLGAGAGLASLPLAHRFDQVIAVEPDQRMLAVMPPLGAITRVATTAEAVDFPDQSADAVVCATSFHWMDQQVVLANAHRWLRSGGVFFAFLQGPYEGVGQSAEIVRQRRREWLRWRDRSLGAKADYGKAIKASGLFSNQISHSFQCQVETNPQQAAALLMTTSYVMASAQASGNISAYEDDLANDLACAGKSIILRAPLGGVIAVRD